MQSLALRLYGKNDLRLERFELPSIADDEILADVVTNSICMSDHKALEQGAGHKRVPKDIAQNPVLIGHEFCGNILQVGKKYASKFRAGTKYSIQPAISYPGRLLEAPGYSFRYTGGQATRVIIPREVLEQDCLLTYAGEGYFKASLSEPVSCIVGAFNTQYHFAPGTYGHKMGILEKSRMALLAGAGPMGLCTVDYALHGPQRPGMLMVTDIDQARLDRAAGLFSPEEARRCGVDLKYLNTGGGDPVAALKAACGGDGYDDVFVFAPVVPLIEQGSRILAFNGCLNFFAGPTRADFMASVNFYDVHYSGHHIVGSSGGNTEDLRVSLDLMARKIINPAVMVTHVGGLDSAGEATAKLPSIPGGKKLIYTHLSMPLTALNDLEALGKQDPFYRDLGEITGRHQGLWSLEAEQYVLKNAKKLEN